MTKMCQRASLLIGVLIVTATPGTLFGATYRVVASMPGGNNYVAPYGIIEGSAGLFYTHTAPVAILSVTRNGALTLVASFTNPPYGGAGSATPASNGLMYSYVGTTMTPCCSLFSFRSARDTVHIYPAQDFSIQTYGNLPSGRLFGVAYSYSTLSTSLATMDLNGGVAPFYQFPSSNFVAIPIYGADGNYYGTGADSGTSLTTYFYRVTPSGAFTQLATLPFANAIFWVGGGLVLQATDGNFYGVQEPNGACPSAQHGAVYKLTPAGQFTILHDFGACTEAVINSLIQGSDGKLYGATQGNNRLFSLTTSGTYKELFQTSNGSTQGVCPCWLVQGSDGLLYGTAQSGGPSGDGVVFSLDAGLPVPQPQAQHFEPTAGPIGTTVRLWGYNLFGASVDFNGMVASNVYNSGPNYVWAVVPTGATTGPITITTPGGAVTTKASFTVQ